MSSKKIFLKDNNKTAYWVGHVRLKPLDTEVFQKKKVVDDVQASLTGATIEQSVSRRENYPYLLQEAEEANADADVTVESNKIDGDNNNMIISMEE